MMDMCVNVCTLVEGGIARQKDHDGHLTDADEERWCA